MRDELKVFEEDARDYNAWRQKNPSAYVLNTPRIPTPHLMVLHRADCERIGDNDTERTGKNFEQGFMRVCATSLDTLRAWARDHGSPDGTFTERCPLCQPVTERASPGPA